MSTLSFIVLQDKVVLTAAGNRIYPDQPHPAWAGAPSSRQASDEPLVPIPRRSEPPAAPNVRAHYARDYETPFGAGGGGVTRTQPLANPNTRPKPISSLSGAGVNVVFGLNQRDWYTELCDCSDDPGCMPSLNSRPFNSLSNFSCREFRVLTGCHLCFCWCCMGCSAAEMLEESTTMGCCFCGLVGLRTKLRTMLGIRVHHSFFIDIFVLGYVFEYVGE